VSDELERAFADCGGPFDLTPDHTITCWEAEPTSGAELAIMRRLKAMPRSYAGKRMLHIGVGNSAVPLAFAGRLARYVGLTISQPELELFERRCAGFANASALLVNKYDPRAYPLVAGEFDLIIDTLLKSCACCEKHFLAMMGFYASKLAPGGALLTTERGVLFGWSGTTLRAFTPGAGSDPAMRRFRVLGVEALQRLAEELGLAFSVSRAPPRYWVAPVNDRIITLTKR
jgi:hypothetical protein